MDKQQVVCEKITECMRTIFAFCISRTANREEAEDLSQEIVKEVLKSAESLRDEHAFYAWMWAIANNVYKGYLRKRKKIEYSDIDENLVDSLCKMPETAVLQNEELNILRRELSLLSERYRKATIMYYIDNKGCKHISQELEISLEMVKYLLFKSRKILKEGMNMVREYGEKSYNPGIFNIDVWMDEMEYKLYYDLFDRRLPGNILLAAYYNPMTVGEMSIEDLHAKTKDNYPSAGDKLYQFIGKNEDKIRNINFRGCDYSKNRLYWLATHIVLLTALFEIEEEMKSTVQFPLLSNGTHGYIWGTNSTRESDLFNGIYGHDEEIDDLDVCNFKIIEKCQWFYPTDAKIDMLIKTARNNITDNNSEVLAKLISKDYIINDNGKYNVNFPVFTESQFNDFIFLMTPAIKEKSTLYLLR